MSDFKPPAKGIVIHSVAFIVATLISNLAVRFLGLGLTDVDPGVVAYFINPALIFFIWPWVISWFRLNYNRGLAIYIGVVLLVSPYALWWHFSQQWGEEVVSSVLNEPSGEDAVVALILASLIAWRLWKLDERFQLEVSENNRRQEKNRQDNEEAEEEELRQNKAPQASNMVEVSNSAKTLAPGLPKSVRDSYKLPKEKPRFDDEEFYKAALDEVEEDEKVATTWAKALTLCKGDTEAAKWKYVELRVEWLCQNQQ